MNNTPFIYDIIPPFYNASYQPVVTIDPRYISNEIMANDDPASPFGTANYTPELADPRFNLFGLYFIQLAGNHEIQNGAQVSTSAKHRIAITLFTDSSWQFLFCRGTTQH
jgi:hypothetical protein